MAGAEEYSEESVDLRVWIERFRQPDMRKPGASAVELRRGPALGLVLEHDGVDEGLDDLAFVGVEAHVASICWRRPS